MRTRRTLLVGAVSIATTFAWFNPTASAAPKSGDRCALKEVGKKSGLLTCVQMGTVRRWEVTKSSASPKSRIVGAATRSASAGEAGGAGKDPIKLGIALGQSGVSTANIAQDQLLGVQLAEKYFNDNGGVNGRAIKLVVRDTAGDEAGAVAAFNTLISSDRVVGIVGPTLSQQAFAADPQAEQAKVPVIGPSNTAVGVPQIGSYVARVSADVASYLGNSIKYAASLQPMTKAVVFFAQDDAFSRKETVVFQSAITAVGIEMLAPQTFKSAETDFSSQSAFVLANTPDLVAISGLAPAGHLVRKLREQGFKGLIVGGTGLNAVQTFSACKAQCDGLILAQAYSPELPSDGVNVEFRRAFKEARNRDPGQSAAQAFTAVQVFVEALRSIDNAAKLTEDLAATRAALNVAVLSGVYFTPLGEISFDPDGEIVQKNFYVAQIRMLRGDSGDGLAGVFNYVQF